MIHNTCRSAKIMVWWLLSLTFVACGGSGGDDGVFSGGGDPSPSPSAAPSVSPGPTPTVSPGVSPTLTPQPSPTTTPQPPFPTATPMPADQCDTTAECQAIYGSSATDCLNSQSDQSICMCGDQPCAQPVPTPTSTPAPTPGPGDSACRVEGELRQWHRVALLCSGVQGSESDSATFTDHRMIVEFSQGSRVLKVHGHYAANGNAADSGATSGDQWRVYFSPPETGDWEYRVSFRRGDNIAVEDADEVGDAVAPIDGESGGFSVSASQATGRDMRAQGLLRHVEGERYLRFAGSDKVFVSGGMDSPENIFGYDEFDNTEKFDNVGSCKGILHSFAPHADDVESGDPTWDGGRGRHLLGLVNYIADRGVNTIYIMMMTVNGDGCDAHPWTEYSGDRLAFDVSKLDQWERVLGHMTEKGIMIHAMTQETENDQLLNNGNLGFERKLYYRELISRFGHHPALQWNLGEENTNTSAQQKAFAAYIRGVDPYQHPIVMHTFPNGHENYAALLGDRNFDGPTFQMSNNDGNATGNNGVYAKVREWLGRSADAGWQWVVTMTEDSSDTAPTPNSAVTRTQRVGWMWANPMAGGGGFEWYLKRAGQGHAYDLAVEDLREFDAHWEQTGHVVRFFNDILQGELGLDLQSMGEDNDITESAEDWVLSDPGQAYVVFRYSGGDTAITLPNDQAYQRYWFNPRSGQWSEDGSIAGPGAVNIGAPPSQSDQDWAVVLVAGGDSAVHPDIVEVIDIPPEDILAEPRPGWEDSYSVGDACYCDSTFDHGVGDLVVNTPQGDMTVREVCELVGPGPGSAGRPVYNDIQCGNGPPNDAGDEDYCPGRVDIGRSGCGHIGPRWNFSDLPSGADYVERDGVVIFEAENATSSFGEWQRLDTVNGSSGRGYLEFTGNSPINGPARSPLEYEFQVEQGGLWYLMMHVARERLTIGGEVRNDVANDAYVRLEGEFSASPDAGNSHGDPAPLDALRRDTKFFGGDHQRFVWASGNRLDLGGETNKRVAVYALRAGETYRLVVSGRSQFFKINRIVMRHESVAARDAENLSLQETLN